MGSHLISLTELRPWSLTCHQRCTLCCGAPFARMSNHALLSFRKVVPPHRWLPCRASVHATPPDTYANNCCCSEAHRCPTGCRSWRPTGWVDHGVARRGRGGLLLAGQERAEFCDGVTSSTGCTAKRSTEIPARRVPALPAHPTAPQARESHQPPTPKSRHTAANSRSVADAVKFRCGPGAAPEIVRSGSTRSMADS
jgi:hypothetical protein